MESEEDEVSLVVEGGNLSTHKLGVLWKESSEHSTDAVAQACREVVKNHLWRVFGWIFSSSLQRQNIAIMMGRAQRQRSSFNGFISIQRGPLYS